MWCEIERHFTLNAALAERNALADIEMYIKRFPEEPEKLDHAWRRSTEMSGKPDGNTVITVEVTANHIYGANPDHTTD